MKKRDLYGRKFGRLTVLDHLAGRYWVASCVCGGLSQVRRDHLLEKRIASCGCITRAPRDHQPPPPVHKASWIPLSQGRFALVDDRDVPQVSKFLWMYNAQGSACRNRKGGGGIILLHRFLLREPNHHIDHKNRNKLDNRRQNLRAATASQNLGNQGKFKGTSKFKGVSWDKDRHQWKAQLQKFLGRFSSQSKAAEAYDVAAVEKFGPYALTNKMLGLLP